MEAEDSAFATLVVRKDSRVDSPVALDALVDEIKDLKEATDVVVIEVKEPGNPVARELLVKKSDFDKLATNGRPMDEILASARGTKGRPKGSRNNGS